MNRLSRLLKLGHAAPAGGYCFTIELPPDLEPGDSVEAPASSTARLFEGERELGPAHAAHSDIREQGLGRFSHWGRTLYLSSSDGSPVPSGKHRYRLLVEPRYTSAATMLREAADEAEQFATEY